MPTQDPSLFGLTPELYQQQQDARAAEQATNFAQLDPSQRGAYGMFMAGRGVGNALSAPDPMHNILRMRQAVTQEIDSNDPQSFLKAAQKLYQAKDYQGAEHLVKTYRELDKTMAEAAAHRASAYKSMREGMTSEQKNAAALTDSMGLSRDTPEYMAAYNKHLAQLTMAGKQGAHNIGVAEGSRLPVYISADGNEQFIFKASPGGGLVKEPYAGGVDRTTAKTDIKLPGEKYTNKFMDTLGEEDAKRVKEAIAARDTSQTAINSLAKMAQLDAQGLTSGAFATGRVGAANFLNTLGLISEKDVANLSRSEQFSKVSGDIILSALGGKLGAQVSDSDREFIRRITPQLENSPAARKALIEFLQQKHQGIVDEANALEDYGRKNQGLHGYKPKVILTPQRGGLASYSTEELQRMLAEAQKGKR